MFLHILAVIILSLNCDFGSTYRVKKHKPVKADCILEGYKHGDTWVDQLLPCKEYRCVNGHVYPKYTGCILKDTVSPYTERCYAPNQSWKEGCSTRKCKHFEDTHGGRTAHLFVIDVVPGCLSQDNECKSPEDVWTWQCDKYTCVEKDLVTMKQATIKKIGKVPDCLCCKHKDKCYKPGAAWSEANCTTMACQIITDDSGAVSKVTAGISSIPGCHLDGRCYYLSNTVRKGCDLLECAKHGDLGIGWKTIEKGCLFGDRCLKAGESIKNEKSCNEQYCDDNGNIIKKDYGCLVDNKCITFGQHFYDEACYYKQCYLEDNISIVQAVKGGCLGLNGKCYSYGDSGFSKEIKGKVVTNCTCGQKGTTGSVTTCSIPNAYGTNSQVTSYSLDNDEYGESGYVQQSGEMSYTSDVGYEGGSSNVYDTGSGNYNQGGQNYGTDNIGENYGNGEQSYESGSNVNYPENGQNYNANTNGQENLYNNNAAANYKPVDQGAAHDGVLNGAYDIPYLTPGDRHAIVQPKENSETKQEHYSAVNYAHLGMLGQDNAEY